MRRNNTALLFEKDFLNSLLEDESSCVKIQEQNYHLALHPFHLNNVTESLKDILNQGIAKYDKKLGGILLGYQNIKLVSQSGAVTNDSFFIHIDIKASFFLFNPEIGKILTGTVNKKSKDHVACLVHKTFNVSLPKPEGLDDDDDWMGGKVEIGQEILFRIIFINLEGRLPYIKAEFVAILGEQDSGISTSEENVESKSNKTSKKPTKIIFENSSDGEEIETTKKKKKKRKREEDDNEDQEKQKRKKLKHDLDEEEHVHRKKKKKSQYKDLSGISELETDENHTIDEEHLDGKKYKRKSKHKDRSNLLEPESHKSNEEVDLDSIGGKKKKKSKHKHHSDVVINENATDHEINLDSINEKKKKKKSKHRDQRNVSELENEEITFDSGKKKKTSKHNNVSPMLELEVNENFDEEEHLHSIHGKKNKKSKHKEQELELNEEHVHDHKKKRKKHKKRSYTAESD